MNRIQLYYHERIDAVKKIITSFIFLISDQKKLLTISFILLFITSLCDGLSIASIFPLVDIILSDSGISNTTSFMPNILQRILDFFGLDVNILSISLLILGIFLSKAAVKLATHWCVSRLQNVCESRLIHTLFLKSIGANINFHTRITQGRYVAAFSDEAGKSADILIYITSIIGNTLTLFLYTILLVSVSLNLTIIALAGGFLLFIPIQFLSQSLYRSVSCYLSSRHDLINYILEVRDGTRLLKSFGKISTLVKKRFDKLSQRVDCLRLKKNVLNNSLQILGEPLGIIITLGIISIAYTLFHMTAAGIIIFLFIYSRLIPLINQLLVVAGELVTNLPALDKIQEYLRDAEFSKEREGGMQLDNRRLDIEFRFVSFQYGDTPVLKNINFCIKENQFIYLVGASGAGKSTILDLILGFRDPFQGHILIDGIPLSSYDIRLWRTHISYVSQECFLFSDSILRNICLRLDSEDLIAAQTSAKFVKADLFVERRLNGYETFLENQGINLSGGERQRIALARAITPIPRILICDEPTNAIDRETELIILEKLLELKGRMTIIFVTHSNPSFHCADQILRINNGNVESVMSQQ